MVRDWFLLRGCRRGRRVVERGDCWALQVRVQATHRRLGAAQAALKHSGAAAPLLVLDPEFTHEEEESMLTPSEV